jgi:hypothetical protein
MDACPYLFFHQQLKQNIFDVVFSFILTFRGFFQDAEAVHGEQQMTPATAPGRPRRPWCGTERMRRVSCSW